MGISITCIDTLHYTPTINALDHTLKTIGDKITKIYWFSDIPCSYSDDRIEWIKINPIKNYVEDYNYITLKLCPKVCIEDFNLIIHGDGFAVNQDAWTDEFLNYDYIGAIWGDGVVGNGGFCLRSRKLYDAFLKMDIKCSIKDYQQYLNDISCSVRNDAAETFIPEDAIICRINKNTLENEYDVKFAPADLANRFSIEHNFSSSWLGKSLGFHGKHGIAKHYGIEL
jgi:hypothetical protein